MTVGKTQQIRIDIQGSNSGVKPGDDPIERFITVKNRGSQRATIDLWVKPSDDRSEPLRRWCSWSPASSLSLEAGAQGELTLQIEVPQAAEPGLYSYVLYADAPQYPDESIQRPQQLQVLVSDSYLEARSEPIFSLAPPTSSDKPISLAIGETLPITIQVENRSRQVDSFRLFCPELEPAWFDIVYPTKPGIGEVTQTDDLPLNPGDSGSITLLLRPPTGTVAGNYYSTVRLKSDVRSDLVFLDVIYFEVQVDDRLGFELAPTSRTIARSPVSFDLILTNAGNIQRTIALEAGDEAALFHYELRPTTVKLLPGETQMVSLTAKPQKGWRRSWREGQDVPFTVQPFDPLQEQAVLPLSLPAPVAGTLVWLPYPFWQRWLVFRLPLLLLLALILLAVLGLGYWALWRFLVKPSLLPKLVDIAVAQKTYQEDTDTPVRFNWTIQNPGQLKTVQVSRLPPAADRPTEALLSFDSTTSKPTPGQPCSVEKLPSRTSWFKSLWQFLYQNKLEMQLDRLYEDQAIRCQAVPTQTTIAGNYTFKLEVFAQPPQSASSTRDRPDPPPLLSDSKTLKDISVTAAALPSVSAIASKVPVYREPNPTSAATDSDTPPAAQIPAAPIKLSWTVANAKRLAGLELKVVKVMPNGAVSTVSKRYTVEEGIPVDLQRFCRLQTKLLTCEDVPIDAKTAGQYTFLLNPILRLGQTVQAVNQLGKTAAPIQIKPPLPDIAMFKVNNQDALTHPRQIFTISPARGAISITLAWTVKNPDRMKVEMLPAPGVVKPSQSNNLIYTLSPNPGSTTLTLRVTNQAGEISERAVVLETTPFVPLSQSAVLPPPPPPDGSAPSAPAAPDTSPRSNDLPPFELPPKAN